MKETAQKVYNLFNHHLTGRELHNLRHLFDTINASDCDELAKSVSRTLETRVARHSVPFCSERQAMALAYAIDNCGLQV